MKLVISTLFLLISSLSWAQAQRLKAVQVAKLFYQAGCHQTKNSWCRGAISIETYNQAQIRTLPYDIQRTLINLASDQAQIWGDTILEGDYAADGKTQLDAVVLIKKQSTLIGYSIRYSERAWYTGDCNYTYNNPQSLKKCREGRIHEVSFVSTDMSHAEVDENQFAEFVPGR